MPIYGIEQNTDLKNLDTKIIRFNSLEAGISWRNKDTKKLLEHQDQYNHHRIKWLYSMPPGYRKPSKNILREMADKTSTPSYPRNEDDIFAAILWREGTAL